MKESNRLRHAQLTTVYTGLLLFSLVLILLQLWLCVSALELALGGDTRMAVPAGILSVLIFAVQVWIYLGLRRIETRQ